MQAQIEISDGIIKSIKKIDKGVRIIKEKEQLFFENGWLFPGFTDSHGHILGLGKKLNTLNLEGAESPEECVARAVKYQFFQGEWLTGRGWNQELWSIKEFPTAEILDKFFPTIPVCFTRIDGHAAWVNSKAMQLADIGMSTLNPPGGTIVRDEKGYPTGLLLDRAMQMVDVLIPYYSDEQIEKMIVDSMAELKRNGVTEVHDMDVSPYLLPIYKKLDEENRIPIRINAYLKSQDNEWKKYKVEPYKGRRFNLVGLKFYADGALGSRGAALLEPYSDERSNYGLLFLKDEDMFNKVKSGVEGGFQIAIHAIGDEAVRQVLKTYARLYDEKIADDNNVLRLEHAQIINPEDLEYFSKYKIIASVQPVHCISDAPMAEKRLGKRISDSYRWRSLIDAGATLISGSDFPIESHNPFIGFEALVNRKPFNQVHSWQPQERITREEALAAYTINPAVAIDRFSNRGLLQTGMEAIFCVLDRDIMNCPAEEIAGTKVLYTE